MSQIYEMIKNVSNKTGDKTKKFCAPLLDQFGISNFYHHILTDSGHYAASAINQDCQEWLFSGSHWLSIPFLRDPSGFREGIQFTQVIPDDNWEKLMDNIGSEFSIYSGLQITTRIDGGVEAFGFGLKTRDPFQHMAFLNQLPFLNIFIAAYKKEFQNSILKDNLVDIATVIGPGFYEKSSLGAANSGQQFLNGMNIAIPTLFTRRESEVVKQLLNGYSASKIGDILFLSKRTIEHHLERLKINLDCYSKAQLIQKLRELESMGVIRT